MRRELGSSSADFEKHRKLRVITEACKKLGKSFVSYEPSTSGRNLGATMVQSESGEFVLKEFIPRGVDEMSRFTREVNFLLWSSRNHIAGVPRLLGQSVLRGWIAMEKLNGRPCQDVSLWHINRSADFLLRLADTGVRGRAGYVGARERLSGASALYRQLNRKLKRARATLDANPHTAACSELVYDVVGSYSDSQLRRDSYVLARFSDTLSRQWGNHPFMSPSDFGLHNSIELAKGSNGHLGFVDFEYAGLDHPLKAIMDFMLQPDYIVSRPFAESFLLRISERFPLSMNRIPPEVWRYFIMKWLAIITLSEFAKPISAARGPDLASSKLFRYWSEFGGLVE